MTPEQLSRPPLDQRLLESAAAPWSVEVVERTASTNALVADRARAGAPEGLVVAAEHQTAGRGRLDRGWVTPERAALTFSVVLRPAGVAGQRWPWLPLLVGVAVVDGVAAAGGAPCDLKWPNDVMHGGLKLGGLLAERLDTPSGPAAIVGVGLNVTTRRDELPVETATSLLLAQPPAPDRSRLLIEVLAALRRRYDDWTAAAGAPDAGLADDYRRRCETLGRRVRVTVPAGDPLLGTAVGVDDDGGLVVETAAGRVAVSAGDVVHVRPATGSVPRR